MAETTQYHIGFWYRLGAGILDHLILLPIVLPIMIPLIIIETSAMFQTAVGAVLVAGYFIFFWVKKSKTPGCWMVSQQVIDFKTGRKISYKQAITRWVGMCISALPLGLGFLWVIWDKRKRAWHDYLAGTVVASDASYKPDEADLEYRATG